MPEIDKNVDKQPVGKERGTFYSVFGEDPVPIVTLVTKPPVVKKNPIYQIQEFDENSYWDQIKYAMFNTGKEKKDQRRFNKYMKSKQGQAALDRARTAYLTSEQAKLSQALVKEGEAVLQEKVKNQQPFQVPALKNISIPPIPVMNKKQPVINTIKRKTSAEWLQIAKQYGFNSLDEVKAWQAENGLLADGKFGKDSSAYWKQHGLGKYTKPGEHLDEVIVTSGNPLMAAAQANLNSETSALKLRNNSMSYLRRPTSTFDYEQFLQTNKNFRKMRGPNSNIHFVKIGNKEYPLVVSQGLGLNNIYNDQSFIYDPTTNRYALLEENLFGNPIKVKTDQDWAIWYTLNDLKSGKKFKVKHHKGGTMDRINYFQQGGAAPKKQDMQQQLISLVQAAMQGDQKATNAINHILEAAKAGDQQAMQLAQMIQQIAKQMKGQATTAKWGAKLNYIRSLKYANGGKTCPACQAGAPIQPVKKVEEKACGGKAKKAKKRYFGGWL